MYVHEKVRKYIEECGISQNDVAEKCNMPYSSFCDMMNGKRKMYVEDLRAVCCALEVSPEEFIEYKEKCEVV